MKENQVDQDKIEEKIKLYCEKINKGLLSAKRDSSLPLIDFEFLAYEAEFYLMMLRMHVGNLNEEGIKFVVQSDRDVFDSFLSVGYFDRQSLSKDRALRVIYHGMMGGRMDEVLLTLNSLGNEFWGKNPIPFNSWGEYTTSVMCGSFLMIIQEGSLYSLIESNAINIALNKLNFEKFYLESGVLQDEKSQHDERLSLDVKYKMIAIARDISINNKDAGKNLEKVSMDVHDLSVDLIQGLNDKLNLSLYFLLIQIRDMLYIIGLKRAASQDNSSRALAS